MKKATAKIAAALAALTLSVGTMSATPSYAAYGATSIESLTQYSNPIVESATNWTLCFARPGDYFRFSARNMIEFDEYCHFDMFIDYAHKEVHFREATPSDASAANFITEASYHTNGLHYSTGGDSPYWSLDVNENGEITNVTGEDHLPFTIYTNGESDPAWNTTRKNTEGSFTMSGFLFCIPDDQVTSCSELHDIVYLSGRNQDPNVIEDDWHVVLMTKKYVKQLEADRQKGFDNWNDFTFETFDGYHYIVYNSKLKDKIPFYMRTIAPIPKPQQ